MPANGVVASDVSGAMQLPLLQEQICALAYSRTCNVIPNGVCQGCLVPCKVLYAGVTEQLTLPQGVSVKQLFSCASLTAETVHVVPKQVYRSSPSPTTMQVPSSTKTNSTRFARWLPCTAK